MYFGAAYVMFLKTAQQQAAGSNSAPQVLDWVFCLVINQGDKNQCLDLAAKLGVTEGTAVAAFILLAVSGNFLDKIDQQLTLNHSSLESSPFHFLYGGPCSLDGTECCSILQSHTADSGDAEAASKRILLSFLATSSRMLSLLACLEGATVLIHRQRRRRRRRRMMLCKAHLETIMKTISRWLTHCQDIGLQIEQMYLHYCGLMAG